MTSPSDVSARPLVIGGMHRSGTSLTASLFAKAGLAVGPELLGANPSNPMGHFEDLGFFEFHRRALVAQGICSEGYTASARGAVPATLEQEARDLLASRMRPGVAWGWKEPRTTLFLDFWQERLPDARHVFVFRRPWEVADSLFRRGDETFAMNPTFALDVWTHYNRVIADFVRRQPDRCLVFEISQVIADPGAVLDAVRTRLGIPIGPASLTYIERLFGRDDTATRATIVRTLAPETWRTYRELCDLAGSDADAAPTDRPFAESVLIEWSRSSRARILAREAEEAIRADLESRVQARVESRVQAEVESRVRTEVESRVQAELESRVQSEVESRVQAELESRVQAEVESRVQAEVESRVQSEVESRVRAEVESRVRAEAAKPRPRRSPGAAIRRATATLLAMIAAGARRLARRVHPPSVADPDLLPFSQARERATKRVA